MDADTLSAIGRDVECVVLARAVKWFVEHRILQNGEKTVVSIDFIITFYREKHDGPQSNNFKADLSIADMDRNYYGSPADLARHPSETDERMMVRLLAFAIHANEALTFTKGLFDTEEPDLWQKDLTGAIELWIEVGQPDEKCILKACGRSEQVIVYSYGATSHIWWNRSPTRWSGQELDRDQPAIGGGARDGQAGAAHHAAAMHDPGWPDLADGQCHHGADRPRTGQAGPLMLTA
jgi:hypothetical protein